MSLDEARESGGGAQVISPDGWGPALPLVTGAGSVREMVGPRCGATLRSMYHVELTSGASTVDLDHDGEAVYYVVSGTVDVTSPQLDSARRLEAGAMVHLRAGTVYRFTAAPDCVVIGGPGPVDPDLAASSAPVDGWVGGDHRVSFHHRDEPGLLVPFISADARLVVWYGSGAVDANMNYVVLEPGERNTEHVHAYSEDTIHILEGRGTAEDVTNGVKLRFGPGDTVYIPVGVVHAVAADLGERVVSVGGPCPADLGMLRAAGVDVDALALQAGRR